MFWTDPDQPPSYDAADLHHELTRFGPTRRDIRPPAISRRCPGCHGSPLVLEHAGHRPGCTGVALAQGRALVQAAEDRQHQGPVRPLGLDRPDPASSLAWVVAALCVAIALAAIGLANTTVWAAHHWRGVLDLVALGWAARLLRGRR